jgi:hypothetical protein
MPASSHWTEKVATHHARRRFKTRRKARRQTAWHAEQDTDPLDARAAHFVRHAVRKLIKILMRAPSTSVIYSIDLDLIADTADNGRKAAFRWRGEIT